MQLSDIKKGLIFTLDWSRNTFCALSDESRSRLLDITSDKGHRIVYITLNAGKWDYHKSASTRAHTKREILRNINNGEWIPLKGNKLYEGIPSEYEF